GQAYGAGIFLQGDETVTFTASAGETALVADVITDQDGSVGTSGAGGSGSVVIDAAPDGIVKFTAANTYTGGTIVSGGTLELAVSGIAGPGGIAVFSGAALVVSSGGTASSTTVSSGGTLDLFGGGTAAGFTIEAGGTLGIGSGFTEAGFAV